MNKLLLSAAAGACIAASCCILLAVSPSEIQQLDNFKVSTLKGLSGVAVSAKIIRDKPQTLALLKENDLINIVELALQDAGVEVESPTRNVGLYIVVVKAASTGPDNATVAIDIQSSLLQTVFLARDPAIQTEAQTWPGHEQSRFGILSLAVAKSAVERTAKEHVKNFAADLKAANPKP